MVWHACLVLQELAERVWSFRHDMVEIAKPFLGQLVGAEAISVFVKLQ